MVEKGKIVVDEDTLFDLYVIESIQMELWICLLALYNSGFEENVGVSLITAA